MRPIDPDEFVDSLDFADRQNYCRSWGKLILKGSVERVGDRILEAAFDALEAWNKVSTVEPERAASACVCGVFRVIRQGITERAGDAKHLASRVGRFCTSQNCDVAAGAIRQFEPQSGFPGDLPLAEFRDVADVCLRRAAIQQRDESTTVSMSVRGLAFHVLYQLDLSVVSCEDVSDARVECAQAYLKWAEESPSRAEEWLRNAQILMKSRS